MNKLLLIIGLSCVALPGCATLNECVHDRVNAYSAQSAWWRCKAKCNGSCHPKDYMLGWKSGYKGVAKGGCGLLPPVPPQKYWAARFETIEGQKVVAEWYAGYQAGVIQAQQCGEGTLTPIPTSCNAALPPNGAGSNSDTVCLGRCPGDACGCQSCPPPTTACSSAPYQGELQSLPAVLPPYYQNTPMTSAPIVEPAVEENTPKKAAPAAPAETPVPVETPAPAPRPAEKRGVLESLPDPEASLPALSSEDSLADALPNTESISATLIGGQPLDLEALFSQELPASAQQEIANACLNSKRVIATESARAEDNKVATAAIANNSVQAPSAIVESELVPEEVAAVPVNRSLVIVSTTTTPGLDEPKQVLRDDSWEAKAASVEAPGSELTEEQTPRVARTQQTVASAEAPIDLAIAPKASTASSTSTLQILGACTPRQRAVPVQSLIAAGSAALQSPANHAEQPVLAIGRPPEDKQNKVLPTEIRIINAQGSHQPWRVKRISRQGSAKSAR